MVIVRKRMECEMRACARCTRRCRVLHHHCCGPSFIKAVTGNMDPSFSTPWMSIPMDFAKEHLSDIPSDEANVLLEGPSGQIWHAEMSGHKTGIPRLNTGWRSFALDHNITLLDVLVFTLVSQRLFTVQIFDGNGLEKSMAFSSNNSSGNVLTGVERKKKKRKRTDNSEENGLDLGAKCGELINAKGINDTECEYIAKKQDRFGMKGDVLGGRHEEFSLTIKTEKKKSRVELHQKQQRSIEKISTSSPAKLQRSLKEFFGRSEKSSRISCRDLSKNSLTPLKHGESSEPFPLQCTPLPSLSSPVKVAASSNPVAFSEPSPLRWTPAPPPSSPPVKVKPLVFSEPLSLHWISLSSPPMDAVSSNPVVFSESLSPQWNPSSSSSVKSATSNPVLFSESSPFQWNPSPSSSYAKVVSSNPMVFSESLPPQWNLSSSSPSYTNAVSSNPLVFNESLPILWNPLSSLSSVKAVSSNPMEISNPSPLLWTSLSSSHMKGVSSNPVGINEPSHHQWSSLSSSPMKAAVSADSIEFSKPSPLQWSSLSSLNKKCPTKKQGAGEEPLVKSDASASKSGVLICTPFSSTLNPKPLQWAPLSSNQTWQTQKQGVMKSGPKTHVSEVFISQRRPVSQEERDKALEAAKTFRSTHPSVRRIMLPSQVYRGFWMSFSLKFARNYLPQDIQPVVLIDSTGDEWKAKWLGGRGGLSGGWRKFALDHRLEEGDVCVFEIVDRRKICIKVHIFRVLELDVNNKGHIRIAQKSDTIRRTLVERLRKTLPSSSSSSALSISSALCKKKKMRGAILSGSHDLSNSPLKIGLSEEDHNNSEKNGSLDLCSGVIEESKKVISPDLNQVLSEPPQPSLPPKDVVEELQMLMPPSPVLPDRKTTSKEACIGGNNSDTVTKNVTPMDTETPTIAVKREKEDCMGRNSHELQSPLIVYRRSRTTEPVVAKKEVGRKGAAAAMNKVKGQMKNQGGGEIVEYNASVVKDLPLLAIKEEEINIAKQDTVMTTMNKGNVSRMLKKKDCFARRKLFANDALEAYTEKKDSVTDLLGNQVKKEVIELSDDIETGSSFEACDNPTTTQERCAVVSKYHSHREDSRKPLRANAIIPEAPISVKTEVVELSDDIVVETGFESSEQEQCVISKYRSHRQEAPRHPRIHKKGLASLKTEIVEIIETDSSIPMLDLGVATTSRSA